MPPPGGCPTPRQVKQILLGQAPEAEAEALEAHLDGCPKCQRVLDGLHVNSLITDALKAAPPDRAAPDLGDLVGRLEQLGSRWALTTGGADAAGGRDEPPALAPAEAVGEVGRLGRYRILEVLGAGGMGVVYRAEDPTLRRQVALKVMRPRFARRPDARRRFLQEAAAMAAIKHDHIATIFEVGEAAVPDDETVPFLAMELLEGENLLDRLRHGPLPPAVAARLGAQAAAGLAAAHARGLVHRDLKPGNLWLEEPPGWADEPPPARPSLAAAGRLKLLDFGLATATDEGGGEVVGTPAYMAPEQVRGDPLDARCDLFALGCVLYEMCAGRPPYLRDRAELKSRTPNLTPPAPAPAPPALAGLIARLLAPDPADRPASARMVGRELAEIERGLTARPSRRPVLLTGAAVLLGVVGAGVFWAANRPSPVVIGPATTPSGETFPAGPADDAWCRFVAELPPERQAKAVLAKLRELNPGFDGTFERLNVGDGRVIELRFYSDHVTDISPVRALTKLSSLGCVGSKPDAGRLTDLTPIRDLRLEWLFVSRNPDLADLGPLGQMAVYQLEANGTRVADLGPLNGSRLSYLNLAGTRVRDLSAVRRMPGLRTLMLTGSPVEDLEPLVGSSVQTLSFSFVAGRDEAVLRRIPSLQTVNGKPVAEFLRTKPPAGSPGTKS